MIPAETLARIEALLFASGEPITEAKLCELLGLDHSNLEAALEMLGTRFREMPESGLMLIREGQRVELATKPEMGPLVEALTKSALQSELTRASLEVLAIIAYRAPIARADIDAIRGVNSSHTLRTLLLRGLIEREGNPTDARGYLYRPTFAFLETLGLSQLSDLPDHAALSQDSRLATLVSQDTAAVPHAPASL
jgi:segregation and condensation protein B